MLMCYKFLKSAAVLMAVAAGCLSFTSCGDDEKEPGGGGGSGSEDGETDVIAVDPSKVFAAGLPERVGSMNISTNERGQVSEMVSAEDGIKVSFSYSGGGRAENYDVVMQVEEDGDKNVFSFFLNDAGFVKYCCQIESDGDVEEWWFEYNSDGCLSKLKRTEGQNEVTDIVYADGDITKVTVRSDDSPEGDDDNVIEYGSPMLENKGCLMLFDETFGIDMDEMKFAYFAGLLGKATKHLPTGRLDEEDGDRETYTWTLGANGLPVQLVAVTLEDDYVETTTFAW